MLSRELQLLLNTHSGTHHFENSHDATRGLPSYVESSTQLICTPREEPCLFPSPATRMRLRTGCANHTNVDTKWLTWQGGREQITLRQDLSLMRAHNLRSPSTYFECCGDEVGPLISNYLRVSQEFWSFSGVQNLKQKTVCGYSPLRIINDCYLIW